MFPARTMLSYCAFASCSCFAFASCNFLCSSATFSFNFAATNCWCSAIFDWSGWVIGVGAVTLVDGPSVKIDEGIGTLVRVSITNGATYPKGSGVLVVIPPGVQVNGSFTFLDGSGCVIVVAAVILVLVDGQSVKIDDGSD